MTTATATQEQVEAAKATIKLVETIEKFVQRSKAIEKSNRRLTRFIIFLTIIQVAIAMLEAIDIG